MKKGGHTTWKDSNNCAQKVIPYGVTSIGEEAFVGCADLESISLPVSLRTIDSEAFKGCDGLRAVHIADLGAWCGINFTTWYSNPLSLGGVLYLNGEAVTDIYLLELITNAGYEYQLIDLSKDEIPQDCRKYVV